jgi:predicted dehydrogenase/nucleoside-diphosphate-sugar epimerase
MTRGAPNEEAPVHVAVVGCGAVTESFHLPVLAGHDGVAVRALVDPDLERARMLAAKYNVPQVFPSIEGIDREVAHAALIATPAFLHAPGSILLMKRGLHVLVEKPMALAAADAEQMVAVAREAGVVLTVGLFRRLLPAIRLFRAAIDAGQVGDLLGVDVEVGDAYTWNLTTLGGMRREQAGGGILADMGPHVLDLITYICGARASLVSYADNGGTGVETDCEITLLLSRGEATVPARVELSRTRRLRNTIRVHGSRDTLEWSFGERSGLRFRSGLTLVDPSSGNTRPCVVDGRWGDEVDQMGFEGFRAQVDDWLAAIHGTSPPGLSGESVVPNVRLLEACYANRVPLEEPWFAEGLHRRTARPSAGPGRVLITGASGFIGCRLSERLHCGSDWNVRALVRSPGRAVRLARMPLELAIGDLSSPRSLAEALDGCDTIVHAGIGTSWRRSERVSVNVKGTKNLVEAALRAGVKRFVHLSTIAVYGDSVTGTITEDTLVRPKKGWDYAESKYEAEQIVLEAASRGLPAVVLRIGVVFGPHNLTITARPLDALAHGRLVLASCSDTPSNTIYVDNLCHGIERALDAGPEVNGQILLLSDDDGCTWGEYFGYFADRLGAVIRHATRDEVRQPKTPVSTATRWLCSTRDLVISSEVKGLVRRIYQSEPWGTPSRWVVDRFPWAVEAIANRLRPSKPFIYRPVSPLQQESPFIVDPIAARVSTLKAQRMLGYEPVVDRPRAMALTLAWAQYARIVDQQVHDAVVAVS